jgi:hypothetical protein
LNILLTYIKNDHKINRPQYEPLISLSLSVLHMCINDQTSIHSVTGNPDLDYGPGQPNLYKMMCLKQRLLAEHGLNEGYEAFRSAVKCVGNGELRRVPLISERDFVASHGILFSETGQAGEAFVHTPPDIVGEGNHKPINGVTRSQYVACIDNGRVRGRSAVIATDGNLLLDFQGDERTRLDDELEWDSAIYHTEKNHAWFIPPREDRMPLEMEEAFSLLGVHTDFFGHWMYEYLPKYISAVLSGKLASTVPVLIDSHMPASHRQSLELLYRGELTIIEVPAFVEVQVNRLWCANTLMYMPLHEKQNERFRWDTVSASPNRFAPVIQEMARRGDNLLPTPEFPERRIFLARKAFRHRKLLNSEHIEAEARANGFLVVYPEDYSFAEQVSLLGNAQCVIASEGSAIFLSFFSSPGTRLCILSHPLTDPLAIYNGLLGMHGIDIRVLTGPLIRMNNLTPHDSDYEINPKEFWRLINDWLVLDTVKTDQTKND